MRTQNLAQDVGKQRSDQAADWFLRLQEDVSDEEIRQWMQWCTEDPDNLREFERMRATWRGLQQVEQGAEALLQLNQSRGRVTRGNVGHKTSERSPAQIVHLRGRLRRHIALVSRVLSQRNVRFAAAVLVVVGALSVIAWNYASNALIFGDSGVVLSKLENRSGSLPDGSTLTLAPRTRVAVDFGGPVRNLELTLGEAYFKVSPDRRKPFVVRSAALEITAVGTAFSVRTEGAETAMITSVIVEEGLVEVKAADKRWRVGAGQSIRYDNTHRFAQVSSVDAGNRLTWRSGRLEYFLAPLSEVVADASRYSATQIEIADPKLAELKYTGTIFIESIDDWLRAVETTFPIRVVETSRQGVILLGRANHEAQPR